MKLRSEQSFREPRGTSIMQFIAATGQRGKTPCVSPGDRAARRDVAKRQFFERDKSAGIDRRTQAEFGADDGARRIQRGKIAGNQFDVDSQALGAICLRYHPLDLSVIRKVKRCSMLAKRGGVRLDVGSIAPRSRGAGARRNVTGWVG